MSRTLNIPDISPRERDVHIALARADKENKERMNDMLVRYSHLFYLQQWKNTQEK